ncbi:ICMT-domain-containing protein [Lentinus brumalis]|uniref:Protein-S-isoprenylcysteine O-methyltransferase n=1 Tax=Lentinus brumalis TaxID=2498619 RepID=A0A371CN20_9APHY|nr:ICMT-domain-containing protein [Polyporus brumalis]
MSLSPILTPLLRVALLVAHATCTYYGMTPPCPPPRQDEVNRAVKRDFYCVIPGVQKVITSSTKLFLCVHALCEAATISTYQLLPSSSPHQASGATAVAMTALVTMACVLGIAGGLIRVWCHRTLGRLFTWEMAVLDEHKLVTTGPYSFVRHPSYTGWLLVIAGNFVLLLDEGSLFSQLGWWNTLPGMAVGYFVLVYLTCLSGALVHRMRAEDEVMQRQFRGQWDEWVKKTPYSLVPFVY